MLEVCFSDSVKGSLLFAQNCIRSNGESVSIITDSKGIMSYFEKKKALKDYRKRKKELQKQAISLGGKSEDAIGISLNLSQGDIKAKITVEDCPRKDYLYSLFSFDRFSTCETVESSFHDFWKRSIKDLEKLTSNPKMIRIWLDKTPDAQCGLLFVCDLLKNSNTEIHVVELPEKVQRNDKCIVEYRGWGEIEPELFGTFLDQERILTKSEINQFSQHWENLKEENSPLRVLENNVVIGVDENYYDHLIKSEFPHKTCKVANIIGNVLGKQNILIGDVFIAKRIQHFINSGELVVVNNADNGFYGTVVCCASDHRLK